MSNRHGKELSEANCHAGLKLPSKFQPLGIVVEKYSSNDMGII